MKKNKAYISACMMAFVLASCESTALSDYEPQHVDVEGTTSEPELVNAVAPVDTDSIDLSKWTMTWNDEFDYADSLLEKRWISQNSDVSTTIACGRWRENCLVSDGTLKLMNKGPKAGYPSPFTSGNVWTKDKFLYGYFECRYKYAGAPATNNSFWLMTTSGSPAYEIDINEGHYPNEIATNTHNRSVSPSTSDVQDFDIGERNAYSYKIKDSNAPVVTSKLRFSAKNGGTKFHIPEFRIYGVNTAGYPDPSSSTADNDVAGLVNYAKTAMVSCGASYSTASNPLSYINDGNTSTHWISGSDSTQWVEFDWDSSVKIGCIQFLNGYMTSGVWTGLLSDYKIEYNTGTEWKELKSFDAERDVNFSKEYHTYGLEWNENQLIYYYDRKEIRRIANTFCKETPAPIWLSEAIFSWMNPDATRIIGTQMEVDYVRVYQKK
jgi:beta-glucanase (GH16 family)